MAAAPTLGSAVRRAALLAALVLGWGGAARAAVQVLIVSGLGGEPAYEERFDALGRDMAKASVSVAGDAEHVHRVAGAQATAAGVEGAITQLAAALRPGDQAIIVFIGHGSYDGTEYRLNLPGPDLTGTRLAALLDRLPASCPQLVVNTTSASGAITRLWQRPYRLVITATKSAGERNATRLAQYWAQALTSIEADRDKDEVVTAAEAFDYASRQVADSFKADAVVATEHAVLAGAEPSRFVVARLGRGARFAGDAQLQSLHGEQSGVEERLAALKARKASLAPDRYYEELEPVLRELALLDRRVDAREQQLSASGTGGTK